MSRNVARETSVDISRVGFVTVVKNNRAHGSIMVLGPASRGQTKRAAKHLDAAFAFEDLGKNEKDSFSVRLHLKVYSAPLISNQNPNFNFRDWWFGHSAVRLPILFSQLRQELNVYRSWLFGMCTPAGVLCRSLTICDIDRAYCTTRGCGS
jgi:hypothetical protein